MRKEMKQLVLEWTNLMWCLAASLARSHLGQVQAETCSLRWTRECKTSAPSVRSCDEFSDVELEAMLRTTSVTSTPQLPRLLTSLELQRVCWTSRFGCLNHHFQFPVSWWAQKLSHRDFHSWRNCLRRLEDQQADSFRSLRTLLATVRWAPSRRDKSQTRTFWRKCRRTACQSSHLDTRTEKRIIVLMRAIKRGQNNHSLWLTHSTPPKSHQRPAAARFPKLVSAIYSTSLLLLLLLVFCVCFVQSNKLLVSFVGFSLVCQLSFSTK